jgi:hypothetical protein
LWLTKALLTGRIGPRDADDPFAQSGTRCRPKRHNRAQDASAYFILETKTGSAGGVNFTGAVGSGCLAHAAARRTVAIIANFIGLASLKTRSLQVQNPVNGVAPTRRRAKRTVTHYDRSGARQIEIGTTVFAGACHTRNTHLCEFSH